MNDPTDWRYHEYCDRVDEELGRGETRYPIVGALLTLVVALAFWGGIAVALGVI